MDQIRSVFAFLCASGGQIRVHLRPDAVDLVQQAQHEHGDEPVQKLAHRLGYSSQSYYTEQFKAELGMTPCEYRRRCGLR